MENIDIISLGGVGGCDISFALKELNCVTYPYNWIVSSQSFVIDSFNHYEKFFDFKDESVHYALKNMIHNGNKKAVMLHDFHNFYLEKDNVIEKYKRRFVRLDETLKNKNKLIFVRLPDNLKEPMTPIGLYDNFYDREDEDIDKWNDFFTKLCIQYPEKEIHFLIITNMFEKIKNCPVNKHKNLHLIFAHQYKKTDVLVNILKSFVNTFTA
jgi:hypothetical protein